MASFLIELITVISSIVGVLYVTKMLYTVVGFFTTRKFAPAQKQHRFAILVAARNEETVIGNLIESVKHQDYPQELLDVFVVADNCTDNTAVVATRAGAICYERQDPEHRTKGFALQYLVERIRRDYGIDHYEGYFIFDADNLLKQDYVSRMNDAFDAGEKVVTSYRNIKNYDTNWISASYGIHWLRTIRKEHRARSIFRSATRVQGTGYLFSSELIRDGWQFTSLTEDRAFCAEAVANGYRISYNHLAEFYDEQPEDLRIALRQRLRWAKGNLIVTKDTGGKLLWHIFFPRACAKPDPSLPWCKRLGKNLHLRYVSADMLSIVYPRGMMALIRKLAIYGLRIVMVFTTGYAFVKMDLAGKTVKMAADLMGVDITPGSAWEALALLTALGALASAVAMAGRMLTAAYILIMERKRLIPVAWYRKIWFCLMFPLFDSIGTISSLIALFIRVEWKPIPHNAAVRMEELAQKQRR